MKKLILSFTCALVAAGAIAQTDNIKPPSLGVHFSLFDFGTAANIRSTSLATVIRNKSATKFKDMNKGLSLSYLQGVSKNLDFAATLTGSSLMYPVPNRPAVTDDKLYLEATAVGNIKLLPDNFCVVPYITAGFGASKFMGYYSAFAPLGLGLQFKVANDFFITTNTQYRVPITENAAYHFFGNVGIVKSFGKKKAPVVVVPPAPLDTDNDGIADVDDKCPTVAGLAALQGCPDRDGDGIADGDDKCPDVAGTAKYQGCPIPDTDGDGINDEEDKCPKVAGLARYGGCPIPDTDGDGVNDEMDKCPSRPGTAANQGCPEVSKEVIEKVAFAAKNVFFSSGSYKLLAKSNTSLNSVADLMKADPSLLLDVDGHTDSQGSDELNQTLSENRAKSVRDYLIAQGIDGSRLISTGYGETKPVEENNTAAGRAKNRRTEMTVRNF